MRTVKVYYIENGQFKLIGTGPTNKSDKMLAFHTRQVIKNKLGVWKKVTVTEVK